jgi:hypothetical protein
MCLVGMQDVELTGEAHSSRPAVAKSLHAGRRDSDCIGVVPVWLEPTRRKVHLRALDTGRAGSEPDPVRPSVAGSFKTVDVDAS